MFYIHDTGDNPSAELAMSVIRYVTFIILIMVQLFFIIKVEVD